MKKYMKSNIREILDECDEILYPNFQLIYAVGNQSQICGGSLRWRVLQAILDLAKIHVKNLVDILGSNSIEYEDDIEVPWAYPHIRLLNVTNQNFYESLYDRIAMDVLNGKSGTDIQFKCLPEKEKLIAKK